MAKTPIVGISQGASWVSVCNTALRAVGKDRISQLGGSDPNAMICADLLPDAITAVMAANDDWCVLRARAQLSVDPNYVPPYGYLYAYALPNDCSDFQQDGVIAINAVPVGTTISDDDTLSSMPWAREDTWILTNATAVYLKYQRGLYNEDAATLPDWFLHAVHDQLAVSLCMPMRQSPSLLRVLTKNAEDSLRNAIANDDKMKVTFQGSGIRGFKYYEDTRGGDSSTEGDLSDPNRFA